MYNSAYLGGNFQYQYIAAYISNVFGLYLDDMPTANAITSGKRQRCLSPHNNNNNHNNEDDDKKGTTTLCQYPARAAHTVHAGSTASLVQTKTVHRVCRAERSHPCTVRVTHDVTSTHPFNIHTRQHTVSTFAMCCRRRGLDSEPEKMLKTTQETLPGGSGKPPVRSCCPEQQRHKHSCCSRWGWCTPIHRTTSCWHKRQRKLRQRMWRKQRRRARMLA